MEKSKDDDMGFDSLHKSLDKMKKDIRFTIYSVAFYNTIATIVTMMLIFKFMVFN